ncbi:MAG: ribonuclease E/G, partial [Planctomycetota bacterium]
GGLIVIDFIDMASRKHGQQVEETLREACKVDKARVQFARISRFGLLEMSRQRLRSSIRESTTEVCPRCMGRGRVRVVESMALQMLTRMEDHAEAGKKPVLIVQVPKATGEYLMNNKRQYIARIEEIYEVQINLQIRHDLEIPHYRIERQWTENGQQRTEVLEDTLKGKKPQRSGRKLKPSTPIVGIPSAMPEPAATGETAGKDKQERKTGLLGKIAEVLLGKAARKKQQEEEERRKREEEEAARQAAARKRGGRGRRRGGRGRRRGQGGAARAEQGQQQDSQNQQNRQAPAAERNASGEAPKGNSEQQQAGQSAEASGSSGNGSGGNRRRRRRRRGGRGRG